MKNAIPPSSTPATIRMTRTVLVEVELGDVVLDDVLAVVCVFVSSSPPLPVRFEKASAEFSPEDPEAPEPPAPFSASAFASAS